MTRRLPSLAFEYERDNPSVASYPVSPRGVVAWATASVRSAGRTGLHMIASPNRLMFVGCAVAGFGLVTFSARKVWFSVPIAPPSGAASSRDIVGLTPDCTAWFQATMAMGAICIAASWFWRRHWTMLSTVMATLLCVVPLAFPYFVMLRSPVAAAEATWLQMQHDGLLWLGGDIYNNAEFAHRGWKSKAYLIDLPRQMAVVQLPSWSPWEMGLDRFADLLPWLGYSNAFCNFAGSGWGLAVVGSVLLLLSTLQRQSTFAFPRAGMAIALLTAMLVASAVVGWSLPFRASRHIRLASELCSQQQYAESLLELERGIELLPVLGQDTYYVAQRGVLEKELGRFSEYTRLRDAVTLEAAARYDQAYAIIEDLVHSVDPAIRREALRAVARFAIQDYNCARFELSGQRFRLVLRHQPCNLKMIYLLQLQGIRTGRPGEVYALRDWMYDATARMAFGTRKIARAAANQHAVLAAGMEGDPFSIVAAQYKAKRP